MRRWNRWQAKAGAKRSGAAGTAIVLLSAAGKMFRQETARRFAKLERIVLICGRYEGVDERVAEHLATDEISIGDFVLSGGELAAAMILDAVTRLIPGALGNEDSIVNESFSERTKVGMGRGRRRPTDGAEPIGIHESRHSGLSALHAAASFRGWDVPEVLMSGNHEEIRRWRRNRRSRRPPQSARAARSGGAECRGRASADEKRRIGPSFLACLRRLNLDTRERSVVNAPSTSLRSCV